jgi:hypothetical protein
VPAQGGLPAASGGDGARRIALLARPVAGTSLAMPSGQARSPRKEPPMKVKSDVKAGFPPGPC